MLLREILSMQVITAGGEQVRCAGSIYTGLSLSHSPEQLHELEVDYLLPLLKLACPCYFGTKLNVRDAKAALVASSTTPETAS